ncbi:MAG TPA: hypothetical protein VJ960_02540, partial [Oceanipulchritudo sp.]|nr:hypothetical protein [Oceanipulchritudo sp.]
LAEPYSSGKVTFAFDFYLPTGDVAHEVGFGTGSPEQMAESGWGATGNRNRFQTVNPAPQNLAKVPEWTTDILAPTEAGTWYNIWLVYDLDPNPNTVTAYTKAFSDPMEEAFLAETTFSFNDESTDDWSSLAGFATGIGLLSSPPEGKTASDALGALFDNIYVSAGENLTLTPTSVAPEWIPVDLFSGASPDAEWTVGEGVEAGFEGEVLTVTGTTGNAGLHTPLPIGSLRSNFTVTFDMMLPAGTTGINQAAFAVVGTGQTESGGADLFGGTDRFITFGTQAPQALANFGQWPPALGPDLLGGTVQDQWYHVWLVYDGSVGSVDFYAVPMGDPVEAVVLPEEPSGRFDLESDYTDLGYFVIGTGLQGGGDGIVIDNLYQTLGESISLSPTAGIFEAGGDPPSLWAEVEPANAIGDKETGIGWINDQAYPYILHYSVGGWMFVLDEFSSPENIFLYEYDTDTWFWAHNGWAGWHVNLTDPTYGINGWADWTP